MDVKTAKKLLREEIWNKLETSGVARFPLPCYGRIPNFAGSEKAAEKVRLLNEWKEEARVVFANPDYAQQKVRICAVRWETPCYGFTKTEAWLCCCSPKRR
jgi:5-formyltetrahydrofolate cyclo-ligase